MTVAAQTGQQRLTPMMEQYRSIQRTLPQDTILFFRLGDFYEMFFDDAVRASEILNITLTGREGGPGGRIPMCGVPYHAFQGYVKTLLERNLKVALCEQLGDPKLSKGLVERKVTRIITPATYLDEEAKPTAADYLVALAEHDGNCALAWLELSTGEFCVKPLGKERLIGELALLQPREVVIPRSVAEQSAIKEFIRNRLGAGLTVYEDWVFAPADGLRLILEAFKLGSERSLGLSEQPLCIGAAGAALYYLKDHLHTALDHVRLPKLVQSSEFLVIDPQARTSLELIANAAGRKQGSLLACIDRTRTSMGSRTLSSWVLRPLATVEPILARSEAVETLARDPLRLQELSELLAGIKDIERALGRLNTGVANARDLLNLKVFLEKVPQAGALVGACGSELLASLCRSCRPFPELCDLIARSIADTPPLSVKDGGLIRDGFSADLDELRGLAGKGRSWLIAFQQRETERTGIKSLRIKYSGVFGYAIEVSNANLHLVPADYVRRQTLANGERFVVPELLEWDRKISGAEERMKSLEHELFQSVRAAILESLRPLQDTAAAIGTLDALHALAMTALKRQWVRPEVEDSSRLEIAGGRHPVVEASLPLGEFVENDTRLNTDDPQLIVLTGPNMAGKSTYIRQVALIVVLAQMGSFVPARSAKIGVVDRIFTRIGASDNLASGESTFMVEMIETAHILQHATARSLLILDEVGRGTSTFDGVSLAWAICEHLAQGSVRPRTLFATHYHELTQLEAHLSHIRNFTMNVREAPDAIVFLRKVVPGGSDRSYGIHVAQLAGVPRQVTERAQEVLAVLEREHSEATRILEAAPPITGPKPAVPQTLPHPMIEALRALDVDRLTPLEALQRLATWKSSLLEGKETT